MKPWLAPHPGRGGVDPSLFGRKRIGTLMLWFRDAPATAIRLWLVLGFAFSCFIFYGL